jgi:phospholipase C
LSILNKAAKPVKISIFNKYTDEKSFKKLESGESLSGNWPLFDFYGWYDLVITVDDDNSFEYRIAGHVENGKDSYSDPIMGGLHNYSA